MRILTHVDCCSRCYIPSASVCVAFIYVVHVLGYVVINVVHALVEALSEGAGTLSLLALLVQ